MDTCYERRWYSFASFGYEMLMDNLEVHEMSNYVDSLVKTGYGDRARRIGSKWMESRYQILNHVLQSEGSILKFTWKRAAGKIQRAYRIHTRYTSTQKIQRWLKQRLRETAILSSPVLPSKVIVDTLPLKRVELVEMPLVEPAIESTMPEIQSIVPEHEYTSTTEIACSRKNEAVKNPIATTSSMYAALNKVAHHRIQKKFRPTWLVHLEECYEIVKRRGNGWKAKLNEILQQTLNIYEEAYASTTSLENESDREAEFRQLWKVIRYIIHDCKHTKSNFIQANIACAVSIGHDYHHGYTYQQTLQRNKKAHCRVLQNFDIQQRKQSTGTSYVYKILQLKECSKSVQTRCNLEKDLQRFEKLTVSRNNKTQLIAQGKRLFQRCSTLGFWSKAIEIFAMFSQKQLPMDLFIFQQLIQSCANSAPVNHKLADKIYRLMIADDTIKLNASIAKMILQTCGANGNWRRSIVIFQQVVAKYLPPSTSLYETLLSVCSRESTLSEASLVFNALKLAGVPDEYSYNTSYNIITSVVPR